MAMPHEYYLSVIGKAFDEDGVYGAQCVDGFKHFCRTVVGYNISNKSICNPTGYAHSIWDNYKSLGLDKYFEQVPVNQMVDGDWAIWATGSKDCPVSHIAMFRLDNSNGTGIFLGQNQQGKSEYTQMRFNYDGIRGALRPKIYHQTLSQPQSTVDNRNYINLSPQADSWRFYDINVAPVKANAKGYLNPKKFGGLSYYVHEYRDGGTTAVIQTQQFGKVKIYIKHELASVTIGSYKYNLVN